MLNLYQAHIGLTTQCNLRCPHCYSAKERELSGEFNIPLNNFEKILEKLYDLQVFKLIFAYGESLLYPSFFQAVKLASDKGFDIELTTNAIKLSPENITSLNEAGVNKIQISLDYPDERHDKFRSYDGLYKIVIQALKDLKKYGNFRTRILSTHWEDNIDYYRKYQTIADECHLDVIAFLSTVNYGVKNSKIKEIVHSLEKEDSRFTFHNPFITPQKCYAGHVIHLNPWGSFSLCPMSSKFQGNILTINKEDLTNTINKFGKCVCIQKD